MLDSECSDRVAQAAKTIGFTNPCGGKTVDGIPCDLPLLIVRAGRDNPALNETLDHFLGEALARNMPVTFINYPDGLHAFDTLDECETSREVIRQTLAFMQFHLLR